MPVLPNAKHERFAQELARGKTASEAYVLAGYKANDGNAATLKGNQKVRDRLDEILTRAATRAEITKAKVLEELGKIGFSNMLDYVTINASGEPVVDLTALDRDQAAAIQEVVVDTHQEREGDQSISVRRVRFKLSDKRAALVDIGKHLGMFKDIHEISGKDGGPIQTQEVSALDEINRRIAGLAARASKGGDTSKLN